MWPVTAIRVHRVEFVLSSRRLQTLSVLLTTLSFRSKLITKLLRLAGAISTIVRSTLPQVTVNVILLVSVASADLVQARLSQSQARSVVGVGALSVGVV